MNPGSLAPVRALSHCALLVQKLSIKLLRKRPAYSEGLRSLGLFSASAHTLWLQALPKVIQQTELKVASSLICPSFCPPLLQSPPVEAHSQFHPCARHTCVHKALSFVPQPCRQGSCLTSGESDPEIVLNSTSFSNPQGLRKGAPFPCLYCCALGTPWPASVWEHHSGFAHLISHCQSDPVLPDAFEVRLWTGANAEGSSEFLHPCCGSRVGLSLSPAFSHIFTATV